MSAMNRTTLLYIRKVLDLQRLYPDIHGAVLASPEGLVLASSGGFDADASAACASGLMVQTAGSLQQLSGLPPSELQVWTADGHVWSVVVLAGNHLLMIAGRNAAHAPRLRALARETAERLNQALRVLA